MANKRQLKKQQKKQLQKRIVATGKYSEKEVKKQTYRTLESISHKETKKQRAKQQKLERRHKKQKFLESKGLNPFDYTVKQIDSIKLKDIESNTFDRQNYPDFFGIKNFDFEKEQKLKNGERMFFAFRDFAGETSLEEALAEFKKMSNEQLLDRLEQIATLRPQYRKGSDNSNGSAGDYKFLCQQQMFITEEQKDVYNKNRRKKTKEHTGAFKGFQVLKNGNRNSYDVVTPRGLMIIANAIMHNVTEMDRLSFYQNFYKAVERHLPDFADIIPKPLDWS